MTSTDVVSYFMLLLYYILLYYTIFCAVPVILLTLMYLLQVVKFIDLVLLLFTGSQRQTGMHQSNYLSSYINSDTSALPIPNTSLVPVVSFPQIQNLCNTLRNSNF